MRRLLVAVGLLASMSDAFAGEFEMPVLRGSEGFAPAGSVYRWNGAYFGAHFGHSSAGVDFGDGVRDLAAFVVRDTVLEPIVAGMTTLSKADTSANSFGGFAGYNFQFEDAVLGFEVNYSRMSLNTGATDRQSVLYANDAGAAPGQHFVYHLTVDGNAAIRITDLMTFRARAAWAAGQFLPYGFVGFAIARADVIRSATVTVDRDIFPDGATTPTATEHHSHRPTDRRKGRRLLLRLHRRPRPRVGRLAECVPARRMGIGRAPQRPELGSQHQHVARGHWDEILKAENRGRQRTEG